MQLKNPPHVELLLLNKLLPFDEPTKIYFNGNKHNGAVNEMYIFNDNCLPTSFKPCVSPKRFSNHEGLP